MTRRRFFAAPEAFALDNKFVTLGVEEARHLRDVLRLSRGQEAFVFDGEGREYLCSVVDVGRGASDAATLEVLAPSAPSSPESALQLTLGVALLKGDKLEQVTQKATELGAARIVPIITTRADVRLRDKADGVRRTARLRRVALEAAKQSGRARLPRVDEPVECAAFLDGASAASLDEPRVMFAERGGESLLQGVAEWTGEKQLPAMAALVGPEGGWTDAEIEEARSRNWRIITLGGRILRAETAAIAVTALLQHLFGDLK